MPSEKPVIAVRVTPDRHKMIKRISAVCGMSMSEWINEILDVTVPSMERAALSAIQGEAAQERFLQELRESAQQGLDSVHDELAALGRSADAEHRRTDKRPPPTNRGVRNDR